jgi:hypothetical protein
MNVKLLLLAEVRQSETLLKRPLEICMASRAARVMGTNKGGERGSADLSKLKDMLIPNLTFLGSHHVRGSCTVSI